MLTTQQNWLYHYNSQDPCIPMVMIGAVMIGAVMIGAEGFPVFPIPTKVHFHSNFKSQPHLLSLLSKTPQLIQAAKNRLGKMPPNIISRAQ
jgi:hypothetical protein